MLHRSQIPLLRLNKLLLQFLELAEGALVFTFHQLQCHLAFIRTLLYLAL